MNQNDPMKGNTSSEDQNHSEQAENNQRQGQTDAYTASDNGYSYRADEASDGLGYTNPDGTHGFIYQPASDTNDRYSARSRNRRRKSQGGNKETQNKQEPKEPKAEKPKREIKEPKEPKEPREQKESAPAPEAEGEAGEKKPNRRRPNHRRRKPQKGNGEAQGSEN